MNANTRRVVDRISTQEEVPVNVWVNEEHYDISIRTVPEALMADNVRVKRLWLSMPLSIEDAETLRDALQVNTSVKHLKLDLVTVDCFVTLAQGMAAGQNVKILTFDCRVY
jgi:hypothetical protein